MLASKVNEVEPKRIVNIQPMNILEARISLLWRVLITEQLHKVDLSQVLAKVIDK